MILIAQRLLARSIVPVLATAAIAMTCQGAPSGESVEPAPAQPKPLKLPAIPTEFRHPGLLNTLEELHRVKARIEAGEEPWKSAYEQMKATRFAQLNYKPKPRETVSSGFTGAGGASGGAFDQSDDAVAAYTQALMWIFTGDERHAAKAVEILNAWTILQSHQGPNWYMIAQWTGSILPQGAEIIRATYPKWSAEEVGKFSEMLNRAFLPILHNRMSYGNRNFGVINALMAIGVFNNDRAAVTEAVHRWVSYVPSWIYLTEDGAEPVKPDYWLTRPSNEELAALNANLFPDPEKNWVLAEERVKAYMKENKLGDDNTMHERYDPKKYWNNPPAEAYVDGLCAETFRDLGHCDLGFYQLINAAEIAWHQGIDLYAIHAKRIVAFMEFESTMRVGDAWPKAFYRVQTYGMPVTYEIAYNHYHNRMGMELPNTKKLLDIAIRPLAKRKINESPGWNYIETEPGVRASQMNPATLANAWEILTHSDLDRK